MTTDERLDAIEAHISYTDDLLDRLSQQVTKLGETVGVLGSYIDTTITYVQHHAADPDAHGGDQS